MNKTAPALFILALVALVPGASAQTETQEPAAKIVTLDDDGKTIALQVGERFLLELVENYDWNVTVDNQSVVSRVVNVLVVRGAQGLYEARAPGSATLAATGEPACRKVKPPCGLPSREFRVYIAVTPPTPAQSGVPVPEFPSPILPVAAAVGLMMLLYRRRGR